jgi:WD40 repeat protein
MHSVTRLENNLKYPMSSSSVSVAHGKCPIVLEQPVLAGLDLVWKQKKKRGFGLALQYDDRKVVTGSSDQHIAIWDIRTGELLSKIQAHEYATARSWVRNLARSAKCSY